MAHDTWRRNIAICVLIQVASAWLGVTATPELDHCPSGCSLVSAALKRHDIDLSETTLQRKIWLGECGKFVRDFPVSEWTGFTF